MLNRSLIRACIFVLAASTVPTGTLTAAGFTDSLEKAFEDDLVGLSFRYRYEFVDEDDFAKDAYASTLRTRLSVAPRLNGWGFLVEVDNVSFIGNDRFNSTRNGKTSRPVVADPDGTDLNQAAVKYTGLNNAEFILGRQRFNRGNQRFVGGVGWRQNEQTFDALSVAYSFSDKLNAFYSYVANVNRVFGPESGTPAAELEGAIHLLDATYAVETAAVFSGYVYLMDFDDADSLSNATFGVRVTGEKQLQKPMTLSYAVEFAKQTDYADHPNNYDANYYLLEAGVSWSEFGGKIGYEVLEGNETPGRVFQTPLATLHIFQGWADKFLATPANGVEDLYIAFTADMLGGNWQLIFHDFSGESGGGSHGSEIDLSANWSFAEHYSVLLKFATYDADSFSADVNKAWVMLTAAF